MPQPYWSDEQLSITVRGPDGTWQKALDKPFALLGSHPKSDLVLTAPKIPRRGLWIVATPRGIGGIVLSTSAKKAGRFFRIEPGRPVKLRSFRVECCSERNGSDAISEVEDVQDSIWAITWRTATGRRYLHLPSNRPILVGRRHPSHIAVEDELMSAVHCCLYRHEQHLWVIDLCSANGTWKQRKSVTCARLTPGRSIRVGRTRFHFLRLHKDQANHEELATWQAKLDQERVDFVELSETFHRTREQWTMQRVAVENRLSELASELKKQANALEEEQITWRANCDQQIRQLEQQTIERMAEENRLSELASELKKQADALEKEQITWRANCDQQIRQLEQQTIQRIAEENRRSELARELKNQADALEEERIAWRATCDQQNHQLEQSSMQRLAEETRLSELASELKNQTDALEEERIAWRATYDQKNRQLEQRQSELQEGHRELEQRHCELKERSAASKVLEQERLDALLSLRLALEQRSHDRQRSTEQTADLQQRIEELCRQQLESDQRLKESDAANTALTQELEDSEKKLAEFRDERDQWMARRRHIESEFAERERILKIAEFDAGKREVGLIAMKAQLRRKLQELEEHFASRTAQADQALHDTQLADSMADDAVDYVRPTDENCIFSPHFKKILDQALDESGHPKSDD